MIKELTLPCVQVFTLRRTLPRVTSMCMVLVEDQAALFTKTNPVTYVKGSG